MALVLKDRVKETTTTTGTGTLTLGGAVTGYQSFSSAIGNTNTTYYAIYLDGGSEWEVGIGTVSAGALSRDTILASSNAGSAVNFSAGQKSVWCDYPAGKAVYTDASGNISQTIGNISGITGAISTVDTVTFDTTYATTLGAGQLGWNGNDTLGLGMIGGNVIQHIGEDQFFYAKATATITKGQVVMFTGAVGASGVPKGAPATGITDGNYIMGIAAENIANNGFGLVQSFGTLRNVNTSGYADGDILWYDPTVTGGLTKTKPVAPNVKVQMAAVINGGSSGGGTILIRINAGSTLGGSDSNAEIGTPSNGQIITYDGQDGYWKNTDLGAGTGISVSESSTGVLTVTNTAPDQTVSLTAGTGISTSGTYPSFTVTNTAPDQTVVLTAGTGISTSGTYPNFTITNTAPSSGGTVTSITAGTGLSGGTITTSGTIAIDSTVATLTGTQTLTNKTLTSPVLTTATTSGAFTFGGAIDETVYAVVDAAGVAISPSNGTIQTWTLGASRTPTAGTWNEGESMTIMIADGTAYTITWTTIGVTWVGGSAPTLATTGYTVIELWKVGSTIYGATVGDVA